MKIRITVILLVIIALSGSSEIYSWNFFSRSSENSKERKDTRVKKRQIIEFEKARELPAMTFGEIAA